MTTYTKTEFDEILELHRLWIIVDPKGKLADLTDADLTDADLTDADLRYADLRYADLRYADLTDANLSYADLTDADLRYAILTGTNLTGANLTDGEIPIVECIDQTILALIKETPGCFDMGSWHNDCGTTHCRAGWAVNLAGDEGKKLEEEIGSSAAGAFIYAKSCPTLPVPDFYATNEDAIEDMKKRAGYGC